MVGYQASNRVTIKLHDVSKVAGVIDVLVGAGAEPTSEMFSGAPSVTPAALA
ncbi:MAG: hypothetical protein ACK5AX_13060 [Bradyrhizobium sp.]|uniref:hypothetical protein n=1 Tax=Bradyrhizobium sp. TaxID=376 RepID=UPI00391B27BA